MRTSLATRLLPLVGIALALLLLYPAPDHDALVAQGVFRLLEGERGAPIFAALEEHAAESGRFGLSIRYGERQLESEPVFRRSFASVLNVANAERGTSFAIAEPDVEPRLELVLVEIGRELSLRPLLHDKGELIPFRRTGTWIVPGRTALLPPLLAISVALAFRATISALFIGILSGAVLLRLQSGIGPVLLLPAAFWDVLWVYLRRELVDTFRLEVIGFCVALIAMVGVMTRSGGVQGLVQQVQRFARTVRSTLAVAFASGLGLFFDDYSNCLIVGNSMRPLTDRLGISREKLAYIVDSTAAPVAGLSVVSTWIAFEVSTYAPQLPAAGIVENAYALFFQTIPYRYYSIFTLCFVALVIWTGRDFGPMRSAERRARMTGQLVREGGMPMVSAELTDLRASNRLQPRARNALVPILSVLAVALEEIFRRGGGFELLSRDPSGLLTVEGITGVLLEGSGAAALFTASCVGLFLAAFLCGSNALRAGLAAGAVSVFSFGPSLEAWLAETVAARVAGPVAYAGSFAAALALVGLPLVGRLRTRRPHLPGRDAARAALVSTRALSFAIVILFEAWMIGRVCVDVSTADYLVALTSGRVDALWLPALLFVAASGVSFATGTSWGTMSILLPNVVGLAATVGADHPLGSLGLVIVCIGAVLEGSIFGDHCSPISDTTVLSSVASASDHIDHVRTQAPYALLVAAVSIAAGYVPALAFGFWSFPLALATGLGVMLGTLLLFGGEAGDQA
ncbi:MAG: Na+/H+ antiporter NhaC family protein [Myxococcota bacterium]